MVCRRVVGLLLSHSATSCPQTAKEVFWSKLRNGSRTIYYSVVVFQPALHKRAV